MEQQVIKLDRAPTRLADLPEQFRHLATGRWAMCWLSDPEAGLFLDVNSRCEAAWGRSAAELCNRPGLMLESLHPDDRTRMSFALRQQLAGQPTQDEFRVIQPGGAIRRVRSRSFPVADRAGRIAHVAGVAEDVTDRTDLPTFDGLAASAAVAQHNARVLADQQRFVEQSHGQRALLEAVLRQMPAGVIITEAPNGRTLLANSQLEQILGYKAPDCRRLEDHLAYTAIHADGRPFELEDYAHIRSITRGETIINQESYFRHGDGTRRVASVTSAPIRDRDGKIVAAVCTVFDVTESQHAKHELKKAKEAAEAANAAKDRFLAILSHELRTPLTPVMALLSTIDGREDVSTSLREDLALIRRQIELEARLIDDLLDLTRITRGKLELNLEQVDLHETIRQALETCCKNEAAAKGLKVELSLEAIRHHVRGDAARLQQVFWNLIANAVKFTPADGSIFLRSVNDGGKLRVDVLDSGIGIEPDVLPRIFNAFEQGEKTVTRQFGGLGLGLAICRAIVELHGGTITARSQGAGKGSAFSVELAPTQEAEPVETHPEHPAVGNGNARRVLLVEDHEDTARIMARLLSGKGYHVTGAPTAAAALERAAQESFDIVVSDLGLPDRDGLDLIRDLKRLAPVPAIALSGFGMEEDIAKSKAAGFAEHLTKPINFQALLNCIARLLEEARKDVR
jgi:PAS domain S-box-containing protein